MSRWPTRPGRRHDRPLAGRHLWEIGDWGGASEQIGRHWEAVGAVELERHLDERPNPRAERALLISLHGGDLQKRIAGYGVKNPDAIVIELGRRSVLRAVDFKWSLETASYEQIAANALATLLGLAAEVIRGVLGEQAPELELARVECVDGFFVAPATEANRKFLASPHNERREYPIEAHEVVLVPVNGRAFFGGLPGWDVAERLARLDRSERSLDQVDQAERYYRLGAGAVGAIAKLHASIFVAQPGPVDTDVAWEAAIAGLHPLTSETVVRRLLRSMAQRAERLERLKQLQRLPYAFRELGADLADRGIYLPPREDRSPEAMALRERWGTFHRELSRAHREAINAAGLALLAEGYSEADALAELERRQPELERRARTLARHRLREALGA